MRATLQIRWKILIALLAIGIGPLLISGWLDTRSVSALGAQLAEQSGQALSEQTRRNLEQVAENYARRVERERQLIELALRLQAREANAALRTPAAAAPVFWADSFDTANPALTLITVPDKYHARSKAGSVAPVPVSLDRQVFFSPTNVDRSQLGDDAARLTALTSLYREIHADHHNVIHRQFVALGNGLLASYPGHGAFPPDYDARERAWYRHHDGTGDIRWAPPHIDAVSGRAFINATIALHDPDGKFIGVAGIDVSLVDLLQSLTLPAALGRDGEALLTFLIEQPDPAPAEIGILARTGGSVQTSDWREPRMAKPLELPADVTATLRERMREREPGYLHASYNGRDSVVVYQPFGEQTGDLLFIVPASTLVDPAVRAARYVLESTQRHIDRAVPLALAIVAVVMLLAFFGSKTITAPINKLAAAVNRVATGDFKTRVTIRSGDELQALGEAFNAMVPQLREHTRVREALDLAAEVQRRLLPLESPAVPGIDIAGFSVYSEQTGGDYYDFLCPESAAGARLGVAIGDVAGHGIASALLMATVRALLRSTANSAISPGERMDHINRNIVDGVVAGQFMTLCYIDIEPERGTARWCSAGHEPAIRFNRTTNTFSQLAGVDIPLGVDGQWQYHDSEISNLTPDDIVVLATDGIWETRNARGEFFGKARLRDLIRTHRNASAAAICDAIVTALERFRTTASQRDDITAVVFRLQSPDRSR
ncbi:MAG: SpoIIE family protein phosphatase [Gammaproteobacteria bacterium]|jgi:sigma-B regulation protein RsbU (phosphoserine phosphatase)